MKYVIKLTMVWALLLCGGVAHTQSTEVYAGHRRAGVDIMWFRAFKTDTGRSKHLLFFSRNRASTDYHQSPAIFASTNAVSYNFKSGIGIVGVASFLNNGVTAKAGIQFNKTKKDIMCFGWLVADIKNKGNIDLFWLGRYQPWINKKKQLFIQAELFPVYTPYAGNWNIVERLRTGIKTKELVLGGMLDLNQVTIPKYTATYNIGVFTRYDF